MKLQELHTKIERKTARLGVIGLGYVGLPLACLLAEAGFGVVGVEIRADRVNEINERLFPINMDNARIGKYKQAGAFIQYFHANRGGSPFTVTGCSLLVG